MAPTNSVVVVVDVVDDDDDDNHTSHIYLGFWNIFYGNFLRLFLHPKKTYEKNLCARICDGHARQKKKKNSMAVFFSGTLLEKEILETWMICDALFCFVLVVCFVLFHLHIYFFLVYQISVIYFSRFRYLVGNFPENKKKSFRK